MRNLFVVAGAFEQAQVAAAAFVAAAVIAAPANAGVVLQQPVLKKVRAWGKIYA